MTPTPDTVRCLVSCGKQKQSTPASARVLYTSDQFRTNSTFAEQFSDEYWILSAKHHLVNPETELSPYDKTLIDMGKTAKRRWGKVVIDQLDTLEWGDTTTLFVLAGQDYISPLRPYLRTLPVDVVLPFENTEGNGEQKQLIKEYLEELIVDQVSKPALLSRITRSHHTLSAQHALSSFGADR